MLMALGQFIFGMDTLAYQELKRQNTWRHPSSSRVRARPARQFVGPGDDTISLSGVLSPELMGKAASLAELRAMADTGKSWPLVTGVGEVLGAFVIENLNETGTLHLDNGVPRRIQFDLQLARADNDQSGKQVGVGSLGQFSAG